ncbi:MAG: hypothetical protein JXA90_09610, partial [Planctomycetes bacterium]|nr:hypothetical protein [Planctomycetota bacterium]
MDGLRSWKIPACALGLALLCPSLAAQYTVLGVSDRTVYTDRAVLEVQPAAGHEVSAFLDDEPIATG